MRHHTYGAVKAQAKNQRLSPRQQRTSDYKRLSAQTGLPGNDKKPQMSNIYVMQRANGDVFALDHHGRFRMPLFHSSRDAMIARSRNWEMLLFKPVALGARLLKELVPVRGGR